jgi:photosystem II stability/assembly factor-like uncharacterized protein
MKRSLTLNLLLLISYISVNAQWVKTNGPAGITVTKFYEYNGNLFCGTYAQGVFKSTDHGVTWTASNTGIQNKQVLSFTNDAAYLYAGTQDSGVYRSSDGGATWSPSNTGIPTQAVYSLLSTPGWLFAGTISFGVFKSNNNGATWTDANGGALGSSFIYAMVQSSSRLMVEADNYIFYSTDTGSTWNVDNGPTAFYTIQHFLQRGDTIIAAAKGNVFRTFDGGANWSNAVTIDPDIIILGMDFSTDTIYAGYSQGYYSGYAAGLYRSTNWGQNWNLISGTGLRFGTRYDNHFKISGNNFVFGCEELGVFYSSNHGSSWTQTLAGFPAASTIDNCLMSVGDTLYSGTHGNGFHSSPDDGATWSRIGTPLSTDTLSNSIIFSFVSPSPGILLAGTCGNGLYRSTNYGNTWTHITSGLPLSSGGTCINGLTKAGARVVAATTEGVYYSNDNGLTWNSSNLSSTDVYANGLAANGSIVCVGVVSFTFQSGIWRSTNGGQSWTFITNVVTDPVAIAGDGTSFFYASNFSDVFVSNNNGLAWNLAGPGIPVGAGGFAILCIDSNVFVGNSKGIYYSANHGGSFSNAGQGLDPTPNNSVQGLASDYDNIYAGLFRDAVWRRPLADFGIILNAPTAKNEIHFNLYPNPSNGTVEIQFNGSIQDASLYIYNNIGQAVMTVSTIEVPVASIDLSSLADGLYTILVRTQSGVLRSKLILEKGR